MQEIKQTQEHAFLSKERRGVRVTGAIEVLSFDASHVHLKTVCGEMIVEGEELRVASLDLERGLVEVEGGLDGVFYLKESAPKKGWLRRGK